MSRLAIAVMGTGGVGAYFGAKLARAGQAVTFVARGAHLAAIRREGLRVRSAIEGDTVIAMREPVAAVDSLGGRPPADVILLCVKGFDTEPALETVRPVVGASTAVLSLQNGVDSAERIEAAFGAGVALGGVAYVFAGVEAPGVVAHRFAGRLVFGELDGRTTPRVERLRDVFAAAGIEAELSPDIRRVLWEKYLLIAAQAGLTALTRCPSGVIRAIPETWRLYRTILEELAAVARAAGVRLSDGIVDDLLGRAQALAPHTTSSLADDLAQGRRLELETLHGHAVRLGEALGVPTPAMFAVYAALKPHADGRAPAPAARG